MLPIILAVALAVVVVACIWLIVVVVRQGTALSVAQERMTVLERARETADDRAASARDEREEARARLERLSEEVATVDEARDAVETRALVAEAALAASERERDEGAEVRQVLNAELREAKDEIDEACGPGVEEPGAGGRRPRGRPAPTAARRGPT